MTRTHKAIMLAARFRGGSVGDRSWYSNTDQIVTLSLFFTQDISAQECVHRFSRHGHVAKLYDQAGELTREVASRYRIVIELLREHPRLIKGRGDFESPSDPTFTSCRLTAAGRRLAESFIGEFPRKPDFPDWPAEQTEPTR